MTAALTVSFMIRNTSPIGWPPLILLKIIYDGSLVPFLMAGFLVFIPVVGLSICVDSFYYGMENFPVVTAYNFVMANLAEGLSLYCGSEPKTYYILAVMPLFFLVTYPSVLAGFYTYGKDSLYLGSEKRPYMLYLTATYLLVFSLISHKEPRFLLPIVPFCFLMLGHFLSKNIKTAAPKSLKGRFITFYLALAIFVELGMLTFYTNIQFRHWEVHAHL